MSDANYCNICGHPCGPGEDGHWDHDCRRHTHDHRPQFSLSKRQRDALWSNGKEDSE